MRHPAGVLGAMNFFLATGSECSGAHCGQIPRSSGSFAWYGGAHEGMVIGSLGLGALAGCGLSVSGLGAETRDAGDAGVVVQTSPQQEAGLGDAPEAATTDGSASDSTASTGHDGAPGSADSASLEAASDAGCTATTDAGAIAAIQAWPGVAAPTVDGDLSDWVCEDWHPLSAASAALATGPAGPLSATIAVAWDAQNLYVAMRIVDPSVGGGGYDPVDPYNNPSAEVYVSGDAVLQGDYDGMTHHYVTDYRGNSVDYGPTQAGAPADTAHAYYVAAARAVAGGWSFEGSVGWQALLAQAVAGFTPGTDLALDFEVNSGNGSEQLASLIFSLASARPACACAQACCCGLATDVPHCDTAQFARVTLE